MSQLEVACSSRQTPKQSPPAHAKTIRNLITPSSFAILTCTLSLSSPCSEAFSIPSNKINTHVCGFMPSSTAHSRTTRDPPFSPFPSSSLFAKQRLKSCHFAFPQQSEPFSTSSNSDENLFFAEDTMMDESYENGEYFNDESVMNEMDVSDWSFENNPQTQSQYQEELPVEETTTSQETSSTSQQPISSVDARVLESILREGKLDVSTEEGVKKLLEGPRKKEVDNDVGEDVQGKGKDGGDGEYSSKFVSTISDNSFWNSIKAKANSILDSVSIYLENRIERDTQLLASVGLFAWDRVQRDIARALPAAGRQVRSALLASNSSYAEKLLNVTEKVGVLSLPSERTMMGGGMDDTLYDELTNELTTPADEIKQVTKAILDILSGKELPASSSYSANSRRGSTSLRSLAPAGTSRLAERQRRAYQARKKTVLQREKEGVNSKLWRGIGSVSDVTWELKREMEMGEGREAGYRSKGVRKALAEGAGLLLDAGRQGQKWLSESRSGANKKVIGGAMEEEPMMDGSLDFMDAEVSIAEEEIIEEVIDEINLEYAPDGLLSPLSFIEEKRRLVVSLEACLSKPGQTWLTKEVVAKATESGIGLDGDILREVITTMVCARDELKTEIDYAEAEEGASLKMDFVLQDYRRMKEMVDSVSALAVSAAGEAAARILKEELEGFVLSDSLDDILNIEFERVEQLLAELVAAREEEILMQQKAREEAVKELKRSAEPVAATVITDVSTKWPQSVEKNRFKDVSVAEVEAVSTSNSEEPYFSDQSNEAFNTEMPEDEYVDTQYPRSMVEIVSDDEYSDFEQRFKSVQNLEMDNSADEVEEKDNPAGKFFLRVIDAIFFVGEKFFLVGLPSLITSASNISSRYAQAQNRGSGSSGWKRVKNLKTKKSQY